MSQMQSGRGHSEICIIGPSFDFQPDGVTWVRADPAVGCRRQLPRHCSVLPLQDEVAQRRRIDHHPFKRRRFDRERCSQVMAWSRSPPTRTEALAVKVVARRCSAPARHRSGGSAAGWRSTPLPEPRCASPCRCAGLPSRACARQACATRSRRRRHDTRPRDRAPRPARRRRRHPRRARPRPAAGRRAHRARHRPLPAWRRGRHHLPPAGRPARPGAGPDRGGREPRRRRRADRRGRHRQGGPRRHGARPGQRHILLRHALHACAHALRPAARPDPGHAAHRRRAALRGERRRPRRRAAGPISAP